MLKRLSKRWLITGIILGCLLLGAGIAYGAGTLIVGFGSSVGVEGKIIIVAPDPTVDDITVECPEFTISYGDITQVTGTLRIFNNSAYPLTLSNAIITMDDDNVGVMSLSPIIAGVNDLLPISGAKDITVTLTPYSKLATIGEYSYSGSLEFSW